LPERVGCYSDQDPNDFGKNQDGTMGGLGSGRTSFIGAAGKCEHWRNVDLADLRRKGPLKPVVGDRIKAINWTKPGGGLDQLGVVPGAAGILFVKRDEEGQLRSLFVPYATTATMFGGRRDWFACPGCGRPCRVLYYWINNMRCRRCRRLKYASQSEASHWRAQRKAHSIRRRLGARGNALDGAFPPKPRYMRCATYERLRAADAALQDRWLMGVAATLSWLERRLRLR
jgi:hypothetical protein